MKLDGIVIIYLHGFRSSSNSGKALALREMFPDYEIIAPNYSPHDPNLARKELSQLMNNIKPNKQVLVIGTSLGGFWAHWMSYQFDLKAIMINPSVDPGNSLQVGRYSLYGDNNIEIEVTQKSLETISSYKLAHDVTKKLGCFVWVALDDEILDPHATIREFTGIHEITVFDTGCHRFIQFDQMKNEIQSIINSH